MTEIPVLTWIYSQVVEFVGITSEIEGESIQFGSHGSLTSRHIVKEKSLTPRVAVVPPNAEVPGRGHRHDGHEMLCVIEGHAKFNDSDEARPFRVGDIGVMGPYEQHWIVAAERGIRLFEAVWPQSLLAKPDHNELFCQAAGRSLRCAMVSSHQTFREFGVWHPRWHRIVRE